MKYLLDTNVLSAFARGEQAMMARLREEAPPQLAVSVVTEMEIEFGLARNPNLAPRVREAVRALLNTISILPFEREDARVAAQLRANLNSHGATRGSSFASAGSGLRIGTAGKLRNPCNLPWATNECLVRNVF